MASTIPNANRRTAFERAGYRCEGCSLVTAGRGAFPGVLELHHRVRPEDGGTHDPENLAVLCGPCHDQSHGRGLLRALAREESLRLRMLVIDTGVSMTAIGIRLGYDAPEMSRVMSGHRRVAEDFAVRFQVALVAITREQYERARRAVGPELPQADDPIFSGGTP